MGYKLQPDNIRANWEEYRRQCDENIETVRYRDKLVQVPKKIIYTLEGFCLFLDIGEEELKKYEDNKNYRATFKKIRYLVMCRKMHALVNGEGNTRGLIFDLKVNHGIDPKQAREDEDWKITLNLNDGEPPVVVTHKYRETESLEEEENEQAESLENSRYESERETAGEGPGSPGAGNTGRKEDTPGEAVINNGTISLNKMPAANNAAGPPKPEKMNPYCVW